MEIKNIVLVGFVVFILLGLSVCAYSTYQVNQHLEETESKSTKEAFGYKDAQYFDDVPCGAQKPPLGYTGGNADMFERLDLYGKFQPARLNFGQAQCISNPQNQIICDPNLYEKWFWYDTMKVGYPSRDLYAYESPNPILSIRTRYGGVDPHDSRRYY